VNIVYITSKAEDRCTQLFRLANTVEFTYGNRAAAQRIRARAKEQLLPYRRVWWPKESNQEAS
jgi:hypothetical protein